MPTQHATLQARTRTLLTLEIVVESQYKVTLLLPSNHRFGNEARELLLIAVILPTMEHVPNTSDGEETLSMNHT